jgi:hypothetical protein
LPTSRLTLEQFKGHVAAMREVGCIEWDGIKLGPDPRLIRELLDEQKAVKDKDAEDAKIPVHEHPLLYASAGG